MKVCFIGHKKHQYTESSKFFLDILIKNRWAIESHFIDSEDYQIIYSLVQKSYDLVICWQYDFIAPIFLYRGFKTVVVPMYDGSSGMHEAHWSLLAGCTVINFSFTLHRMCLDRSLDSYYFKYAPNPDSFKAANFDRNKVVCFLAQRRPQVMNWRKVVNIVPNIERFYLHTIPDYPQESDLMIPTSDQQALYKIEKSEWIGSKSEFLQILDKSNVFIAPRISEGIGMTFLEAMAKGMFCIAHNQPTHNEYIASPINGVLINYNHAYIKPDYLCFDLNEMRNFSSEARKTIAAAHIQWSKEQKKIPDILTRTRNVDYSANVYLLRLIDMLPQLFFSSSFLKYRLLCQNIKNLVGI